MRRAGMRQTTGRISWTAPRYAIAVAITLSMVATPDLGTTTTASPSPAAITPVPVSADSGGVDRAQPEAPRGSALALLRRLGVKGRAPMSGYSRARFGHPWADADRNGCDTRNDVLRRDLQHLRIKARTRGCVVLAGDLADPYTRAAIHFVRGGASEVDIDHVVALGDAWRTGAKSWSASRRMIFANDPLNLLAVQAAANRSKGDADAASWLPRRKGYRCAYVARQVGVKAKYRLWVTPAERAAIDRVLTRCRTTTPPAGGLSLPTAPNKNVTKPASQPRKRYVRGPVHPGAFCSQHGWYGYTTAHTLMRCKTTARDSRFRWRRA